MTTLTQSRRFAGCLIAGFTLLAACALTGCGEVVVFGHVVREGKPAQKSEPAPTTESKPESAPPAQAQSSASAPEAAPKKDIATPSTPKAIAKANVVRVRAVMLTLTPDVSMKLKEDAKFNGDSLRSALKSELESRKLLDESDSELTTAELIVDDYSFQRTTNVIIFEKINGVGTLNGTLRVRDAQGNAVSNRRIESQRRFGIPAEGDASNSLNPLYRQFAAQVADVMMGVSAKREESAESVR